MACFHPLTAYRMQDGQIQFTDKKGGDPLELPCGQCIGCRLERSRQWAMRCVHEASMHEDNCFITLTYNPQNLPPDGSLRKKDFQVFIRSLRKITKKKFGIIIAANMEITLIDLTTTPYYSALTFRIGSIFSTLQAVNLYTHHRLSKEYGKKAS